MPDRELKARTVRGCSPQECYADCCGGQLLSYQGPHSESAQRQSHACKATAKIRNQSTLRWCFKVHRLHKQASVDSCRCSEHQSKRGPAEQRCEVWLT